MGLENLGKTQQHVNVKMLHKNCSIGYYDELHFKNESAHTKQLCYVGIFNQCTYHNVQPKRRLF